MFERWWAIQWASARLRLRELVFDCKYALTISLKPHVIAYTRSGKSGPANRRVIVAPIERSVRAFHGAHADKVVIKIVTDNIAKESRLHTKESGLYFGTSKHFAARETIRDRGKNIRRDVHSNSADGYFGINAARMSVSTLPRKASIQNICFTLDN